MEEETRRYRPTKNYLSYLPAHDCSAFEVSRHTTPRSVPPSPRLPLTALSPQTEIMRNEFERLAARQPLELLSMKR